MVSKCEWAPRFPLARRLLSLTTAPLSGSGEPRASFFTLSQDSELSHQRKHIHLEGIFEDSVRDLPPVRPLDIFWTFSLYFPHALCSVKPQFCSQQTLLRGDPLLLRDVICWNFLNSTISRHPPVFPGAHSWLLRQACWSDKTWAMPTYNLEIMGIISNPASLKICGFLHYLFLGMMSKEKWEIPNQAFTVLLLGLLSVLFLFSPSVFSLRIWIGVLTFWDFPHSIQHSVE